MAELIFKIVVIALAAVAVVGSVLYHIKREDKFIRTNYGGKWRRLTKKEIESLTRINNSWL